MGLLIDFTVICGMSFVVSLVVTRLVREYAPRLGLVDRPDARRKIHGRVVPLGGGLGVFVATWTAVLLGTFLPNAWRPVMWENRQMFLGLFCASCVLAAVGLWDDRKNIPGSRKLLAQICAVLILWFNGFSINRVAIGDWNFNLGPLALPVTAFWLIGAINALNLIDGSDGLAGTVGIIMSGAIAILAVMLGHESGALIAVALCGALAGFLVFNMPPATIFLGDAGSMFVGLIIGALAISGSFKGPAAVALTAPLVIWTVPILDSSLAIIRRKLTGQSVYATDRGHLHHCLQNRGMNSLTIVYVTGLLCALTSVAALVSVYWKNEGYALFGSMVVVLSLVAGKLFGYAEFVLVAHRTTTFIDTWLPFRSSRRRRESKIQLHGNREWAGLWATMIESADLHGFNHLRLTLAIPWLHESFYAHWDAEKAAGEEWRTRLPLTHEGRVIGHLVVAGVAGEVPVAVHLASLAEMVDSLEERLGDLIKDPALPPVVHESHDAQPIAEGVAV